MARPTMFLVFLSILQVIFSAGEECRNPCACQFNDENNTYIDLSNVGRKDGMSRFFMLGKNADNISVIYSYNPCYPISYRTQDFEIEQHGCQDAAVCIITPGNSTGTYPTQRAIGYQRDAVFFRDGSGNLKIKYTVPEQKTLVVTLKCIPGVMHELEINNETSFTLTTMCACPDEAKDICRTASHDSKSGLSTGSILLITFFVILLVYVGFGILFNFCKGAHGVELLPNFEFWNELPKLIVDGFLFTCSCFGRRSSYADV